MSRVFVLGTYLPKFQASARVTVASDIRTEQIVSALLAAGHKVRLCAATHYGRARGRRYLRKRSQDRPEYYEMNFFLADQRSDLLRLAKEFKPDCVVAVSQWPSMVASTLGLEIPLWCDLWGGAMSEAQAKAYVYKDNSYVNHFWAMERPVLQRADVFSTCSTFQEHFVVGELALMGRLNRESFGYKLARTIPPGIPDEPVRAPRGNALRGKVVGRDDFVILWTGGYNTWTDVDTLFAGLEKVLAAKRAAKFVSFGGCIQGHDDVTYKRFCRLVSRSKFRDRYILLGWQRHKDVLRAYTESDIGINIDRYHYELIFGTRTRLVQMIAFGLPVITTVGCELSYIIRDNRLGLTFEIGDADGMAEALIRYAEQLPASRAEYSRRALDYFQKYHSYTRTCQPLLEWAKRPRRAPDSDQAKRPVLMVDATSCDVGIPVENRLLSLAVERLGDNDDLGAKALLEAALVLCPRHPLALYHLGSVLKRLGDVQGSLASFRRARQLVASRASGDGAGLLGGIYFHLGECRMMLGQSRLAEQQFKKCLAVIPGHRKATRYLSKLQSRR